jgi:Uma2 family endonuclease
VVEVADTSLRYDREVKRPLYARAGVPELWIVNLVDDVVEVSSEPGLDGYGATIRFPRGRRVEALTEPGLSFDAEDVLPPRSEGPLADGRWPSAAGP